MTRIFRTAAVLAAVLACTAGCRSGQSGGSASTTTGDPRIALVSSEPDGTGVIEVTGLADADLHALRRGELTEEAWRSVLRVSVATTDAAGERSLAMVGTYAVTDRGVRFQPR